MPTLFNAPRTGESAKSGRRKAFTLVEVIVAAVVFVMVAAGVLSTAVMVRRSTNQALMRNIAFDASQGFLDQIKCLSFSTIQTAMNSATTSSGAYFTLTCNDAAHASTAKIVIAPNQATYLTLADCTGQTNTVTGATLGDQRIATNTTAPNATTTAAAVQSISYLPSYGIKVAVAPVTDTPAANKDGSPNALLVTVYFEYKYTPNDTAFKTDSVSYLVPNLP